MMKALVYSGPGRRAWQAMLNLPFETLGRGGPDHDDPICGTDLHIMKGDLPTITAGRILGHQRRSAPQVKAD